MSVVHFAVHNAVSRVVAPPEIHNELSELCSYEVPGADHAKRQGGVSKYWDGRIRLLKKDGTFPTGLIGKMIVYLRERGIHHEWQDLRQVPLKSIELELWKEGHPDPSMDWEYRYYQDEGIGLTGEYPRGVYVLGTGGGKSLMLAGIAARLGVPALVLTPDKGLREQFYETCVTRAYKNAKDHVGRVIDAQPNILVTHYHALEKADPRLFHKYKALLIDEFHHAAAKSYITIHQRCVNAYYRYGFTGTFLRTDGTDMVMHGVLSNVIFKKTTSELIDEGFLVKPIITMLRHRVSRYPTNFMKAYDAITKDEEVNRIIAATANQKVQQKKQTLILVRYKEHGRLLNSMINGSVFVSGDDSVDLREQVKKDFNDSKIKCLIATSVFGEGTDIPTIDALINARFEKTEIQTKQGIGRALRKAPGKEFADITDFLILGQKHLANHSAERFQSYRKEPAFEINVKRPSNFSLPL